MSRRRQESGARGSRQAETGRTESTVKVPKYQISAVKKGVESHRQSEGESEAVTPERKRNSSQTEALGLENGRG